MAADFDIPGLPALRLELSAAKKGRSNRTSCALEPLVREIYTDIREYRIAGRGWGKLAIMIRKSTGVSCSPRSVRETFQRIDLEWEKATGVAALEHLQKKGRRKRHEMAAKAE